MNATAPDSRHLLIVEDEEHLAIGMKYNFEAEGYRVTVLGDGRQALQVLEEQPTIDLVILDLMLPGMSGYAVCEALRERGNEVPILMLSARTLTEDKIRGYDAGADQYMEKPFELDELLSRVRNMIYRRAKQPAPSAEALAETYEFSDNRVNWETFEVWAGERSLRLTNMEMKLLRYFVQNEEKVLDRAELLENVWGQSASITTRTVDNFIVRLRKYFEKDPAQPRHFLSVRGAGYRFVPRPDGEDLPPSE